MSKILSGRTSLCNQICAVLLLILVVLQFMPFWDCGEAGEKGVSIQSYIWLPTENTELEAYLQAQTEPEFSVEKILVMPIFVLAVGAIGAVLCLWKAGSPLVSLLPAAVGVVGIWGYLAKAAFRLGSNWQLHLVLCIVIVAVAALAIVSGLKEMNEK